MRNFCVNWVLLGMAFFCKGFSVAPRTGRRPSRLHDLKQRVSALEINNKYNEENIARILLQMNINNIILTNKMDNLYEKLEAQMARRSDKVDADMDKRSEKRDADMDKRFGNVDTQFEKVDNAFAETKADFKADFKALSDENKEAKAETKAEFKEAKAETKVEFKALSDEIKEAKAETKVEFKALSDEIKALSNETKTELKALSDGFTMRLIPLYLFLTAIAITTGMANAENFVNFFK